MVEWGGLRLWRGDPWWVVSCECWEDSSGELVVVIYIYTQVQGKITEEAARRNKGVYKNNEEGRVQ
jgi:hypothetical protein